MENTMKIFLVTANLEEIRQGAALGLLDGVAAMPYGVFKQHSRLPLSDRGMETFRKDSEKAREPLGEMTGAAAPRSWR